MSQQQLAQNAANTAANAASAAAVASQTAAINKMNAALAAISPGILCGTECQAKKQTEELKKKMDAAQRTLLVAEPEYEISKRNYYTYVEGSAAYNTKLADEYAAQAAAIADKYQQDFDVVAEDVRQQIATYENSLLYSATLDELREEYEKNGRKLAKRDRAWYNTALTEDRKSFYEDQQTGVLTGFYKYVLWIVYIVVILGYIWVGFFGGGAAGSGAGMAIKIGVVVLLCVLPFIAPWLLSRALWGIHRVIRALVPAVDVS